MRTREHKSHQISTTSTDGLHGAASVSSGNSNAKIRGLHRPRKQIRHRGQTVTDKHSATAAERRVLRISKASAGEARFAHTRALV